MQDDVPQAANAVPFQTPALLLALEDPLNGVALGIQGFPFGDVPPHYTKQPDVLSGVLPIFGVAVQKTTLSGVQQVTSALLATVQVVTLGVCLDILHRNHAQAGRHTFGSIDSLLKILTIGFLSIGGPADMDNRLYTLVVQVTVVGRRIITTVSHHRIRPEPVMERLCPIHNLAE